MSGRSAAVRQEIKKEKLGLNTGTGPSQVSIALSADTYQYPPELGPNGEYYAPVQTLVSHSSNDPSPYGQPRKAPTVHYSTSTVFSVGVSKSTLRAKMDANSEAIRNRIGSALGIGKKKAAEEPQEVRLAASAGNRSFDTASSLTDTSHLASTSNTLLFPAAGQPMVAPPSGPLPEVDNHPPIRQWVGGIEGPRRWNALEHDEELWDPQGDIVVYLADSDSHVHGRRPKPCFKLSSRTLQEVDLMTLNDMLAEGCMDYSGSSMGGFYPYNLAPDTARNEYAVQGSARKPTSASGSQDGSASEAESYSNLSFELKYFANEHVSQRKWGALRYHIAVRNFFAMISGKSMVGLTFVGALEDLHDFIREVHRDLSDINRHIFEWLDHIGITDCRMNPSTATGLLAWFEDSICQDREGYLTAFCHAAAMHPFCKKTSEWPSVSAHTKRLLESAYEIMESRIDSVETFLRDFDPIPIWPNCADPIISGARGSAKNFRQFLIKHYAKKYGTWPPAATGPYGRWLYRPLVNDLVRDFGALYDWLVDRDVTWEHNTTNPTAREWNMRKHDSKGRLMKFNPDTPDMLITNIILAYEAFNSCTKIPAPYCLVPESIPVKNKIQPVPAFPPQGVSEKEYKKWDDKRLKLEKAARLVKPNIAEESLRLAAERKFHLAYSNATNMHVLGADYPTNDLLEAFIEFEKVDMAGLIDPFEGRRGRWIMIYHVLQVLATIAVDVPACRFKEGVKYFLSPPLKGVPPWKGAGSGFEPASVKYSYCWNAWNKWQLEKKQKLEALQAILDKLDAAQASLNEPSPSPVQAAIMPSPQASIMPSPSFASPLPPTGARRAIGPAAAAKAPLGAPVPSVRTITAPPTGALPAPPIASVRSSAEVSVLSFDTGYGQSARTSSSMSNYGNGNGPVPPRPTGNKLRSPLQKNTFIPVDVKLDKRTKEDVQWPIHTPHAIEYPQTSPTVSSLNPNQQRGSEISASQKRRMKLEALAQKQAAEQEQLLEQAEALAEALARRQAAEVEQLHDQDRGGFTIQGVERHTVQVQQYDHTPQLQVQRQPSNLELRQQHTQAFINDQSQGSANVGVRVVEMGREMHDPEFDQRNDMRRANTTSGVQTRHERGYGIQERLRNFDFVDAEEVGSASGSTSPEYQPRDRDGSGRGTPALSTSNTSPEPQYRNTQRQAVDEQYNPNIAPRSPDQEYLQQHRDFVPQHQQDYAQIPSPQQQEYVQSPQPQRQQQQGYFQTQTQSSQLERQYEEYELPHRQARQKGDHSHSQRDPNAVKVPTRVVEARDVAKRGDSKYKKVTFGGDGAGDEKVVQFGGVFGEEDDDFYDYESIRDFDEYASR